MNKLEQIHQRTKKYSNAATGDILFLLNAIEQIQNILDDPFPLSIYPQLSQLERNIAKMTVIDGMTAQEIADALGSKSVSTVNSYRRMVYKAFGFRTHRWPSLVFDRIREVLSEGD